MPAENKKSGGGRRGKQTQEEKDKLNTGAKAYVPVPVAGISGLSIGSPSTPLKATAASWAPVLPKGGGPSKGGKPAGGPPNKAAPAASSWGKKSDAVKSAAPQQRQSQQRQPQQRQPPQQQQQQQQNGGGGGGWKRTAEKPGDNKDSGGSNGASWGRSANRPGGDNNAPERGGDNRQNQARGGGGQDNRPGGNDEGGDWSRGKALPVELLNAGDGKSEKEKVVKRTSAEDLLAMRMSYLSAPLAWDNDENVEKPPDVVLWDTPTRVADIEASTKAPRMSGDVSVQNKRKGVGGKDGRRGGHNNNDTAPPLEDCKPIAVNNETRWKAKVFEKPANGKDAEAKEGEDAKDAEPQLTVKEILRKGLTILNKLSLTKFDKLSDQFINCGIGRDVECLTGAIEMIVQKAQEEQHFASMYAGLCLKLSNTPMEGIDEGSKKGKKFKKILLERCQTEFETETETKIKKATEGITDDAEIAYHSTLLKKHYLGHMRFIGELYKGDLISIKIMLFCLPLLLQGGGTSADSDVDEEKIECFAKLMAVIGSSLEQQSDALMMNGKKDAANKLSQCWKAVEIMCGKRKGSGPKVSNRMKFLLQDLIEMRDKGWVTRRKEETAKTIAQIHKEVEKEERAAARRSSSTNSLNKMGGKSSIRRGASSGDVRQMGGGGGGGQSQQQKPVLDADGFTSVAPGKMVGRSSSMKSLQRSKSDGGWNKGSGSNKGQGGNRRPSGGKFAALNEAGAWKQKPEKEKKVRKDPKEEAPVEAAPVEAKDTTPKKEYLSADECGKKTKNVLKEFFVGGDIEEAVLSIHELIGAGDEGSIERGAKAVESAILMVLEMKQVEVEKFSSVFMRCATEKKIEGESFLTGLNDPLEFLGDVAIDAPLAVPHMASIVAALVKAEIIPFNFLLNAPEYFRTDQNAAGFGGKVLKKIGEDAVGSEENIDVIDKLMTCDDKTAHSSASDLIAAS